MNVFYLPYHYTSITNFSDIAGIEYRIQLNESLIHASDIHIHECETEFIVDFNLKITLRNQSIKYKCMGFQGTYIPSWLFWYPDVTDYFDPSNPPRPTTRIYTCGGTAGQHCESRMYIYGKDTYIRKYCKTCENYHRFTCWK